MRKLLGILTLAACASVMVWAQPPEGGRGKGRPPQGEEGKGGKQRPEGAPEQGKGKGKGGGKGRHGGPPPQQQQ